MKKQLPPAIIQLFWDIKPGTLDLTLHQKTIIERTLNYGTLSDWQWLMRTYGREAVRRVALSTGRSAVSSRTAQLFALVAR